jgi:anti-anti-sigma factor
MVEGGPDDGDVASVPPRRSGAEYGGGTLRSEFVRHPSGMIVLHAVGELDVPEADELTADLGAWLDDGVEVLLDLSQVTFVGSGGLAALLAANRAATERQTTLRLLCGDSRPVRRALQVSGTLTAFDVIDPRPADGTGQGAALFAVPGET